MLGSSTMMRSGLRAFLARRAPRLLALIRAVRNHRRFAGQYRAFQRDLARRLWPDGDIRVLAGPFAGMRYIEATVHGCVGPALRGHEAGKSLRVSGDNDCGGRR